MTRLSVNVNKVAVLRNSRGGSVPSVVDAARVAIAAGAHGITVHPRPDQRHIRPHDLDDLRPVLSVELNVEGNPFAGPQANGYPGFVALVERARPAQVTLVPDGDAQITSDHGFEAGDAERLAPLVRRFRDFGCRVSVFVDAGTANLGAFAAIGVDRVELYTGPFAAAFARGERGATAPFRATAEAAQRAGLGVNAGHDLDQHNLTTFLREVPGVLEVSIGHALFAEAIHDGLATTVRRYLSAIDAAAR
ncbi:MAG TPA: pyridoxine 5'-phosphate synthase [Xanthomonadales bacterium]|nr:pyridoxine 5'-phosphate synthase [Xanthomonadales bacterium]